MKCTLVRVTADHRNYSEYVETFDVLNKSETTVQLIGRGKMPRGRVWFNVNGRTGFSFLAVAESHDDVTPLLRELRIKATNYLSSRGYNAALRKAGEVIGISQLAERSAVNAG